jgi:glycosyltransferase involved in cell wall biosynthesis
MARKILSDGYARSRGILIIVENLSVPFDRRVWLEATALRDARYQVSIICPAGDRCDTEPYVRLEGIDIYRYPLRAASGSVWSFLREYSVALLQTIRLAARIFRARRFHVIQSCNPPDIFFLIALFFRPFGVRFVFDHHDLAPELFKVRFQGRFPLLYRLLLILEACSLRSAHTVITSNESQRAVAIRRGRVHPERLFVVRNGPDAIYPQSHAGNEHAERRCAYIVTYAGLMAPQDGVDLALRAAHLIVHAHGRQGVAFLFVGDGDALGPMRALASRLNLTRQVRFLGRLAPEHMARYLAVSDVCIAPEPANGFNELHTMRKVFDYMAAGVPIVAFDLKETRYSAGNAALYARPNDVEDFAAKILDLLDDPCRRRQMGRAGAERSRRELSWEYGRARLLDAYAHAFDE